MTRKRIFVIGGIVAGVIVLLIMGLAIIGPFLYLGGGGGPVSSDFAGEAYYAEPVAMVTAEASPANRATSGAAFDDGMLAEGEAAGGNFAMQPPAQERLIIRNGNLSLVVDDTEATVKAITDMVEGMGGFVVQSNVSQYDPGRLYGNMTVRIPAEHFDEAMAQLREMAVEVTNESISGQDVTEEYVDLQARLQSLRTAEQRLLDIMENAQSTEDLLAAEAQLTIRQQEIESIQGRMQYLEQSAALSSINVDISQDIVSQPVEVGWRPGETVRRAFDSLVNGLTGIADVAIFFVISVLPSLVLIALLLSPFYFGGRWLWRRRKRNQGNQEM